MKKQIMSIAAAAALFTTGAMAFDSYNGKIATDASGSIIYSSYTAAANPRDIDTTTSTLKLADSQKGDALIYPYFTTESGYTSEIVVRNTSENAIVAKVVFYSGEDSKELRDFNIYLSGYDVFRFTIEKDGKKSKIVSTDGSVIKQGILESDARDNNDADDYTSLKFASATNKFEAPLGENRGYIAIFGMVQSVDYKGNENPDTTKLAFHNRHADLYAGYAALLDAQRGTDWRDWRNADGLLNPNYMVGSMFRKNANVTIPNLKLDGSTTKWKKGSANRSATFTGVDNVLTGQINISNTNNATDMLLNATALEDFSNGVNTVLWTPGEYASIADRCIKFDSGAAKYDEACVVSNAKIFSIKDATYTYANKGDLNNADNKIFITQPYKRTLMQLKADHIIDDALGYRYYSTKTTSKVETGAKSDFMSTAYVYDENEKTPSEAVVTETNTVVGAALSGNGIGTSVVEAPKKGYVREVEMLNASAFELSDDTKETYGKGNGFAKFNVGVPAIITQMVATKVGNSVETNWVYSDVNK